ncbi:MAG: 4Fe-4S dicluster domain-containing protein [Thermoplasmata archaeon]
MSDTVNYVLKKEDLTDFLSSFSDYKVVLPVKKDGAVKFRTYDGEGPDLEVGPTQKSCKEVFFPQTEKMFDFKRERNRFVGTEEVNFEPEKTLLFGVRPCDARAMTQLDKVFGEDYRDNYYMDRREKTTIISVGCEESAKNCFCTSVGGGPHTEEGSDMLWTDIGDSYHVEILTEKGEEIVKNTEDFLDKASKEDEKKSEKVKEDAVDKINRSLDTDGLQDALEDVFENDYWEQVADRCIGCGICTLLCPTCYCFDINDIIVGDKGWRERNWDSCQFDYYSIHASGYNPRPEKKHRLRNRLYHKYLYMPKNIDVIGCVGCGRCITNCPTDIDIIEVLEQVEEVSSDGK